MKMYSVTGSYGPVILNEIFAAEDIYDACVRFRIRSMMFGASQFEIKITGVEDVTNDSPDIARRIVESKINVESFMEYLRAHNPAMSINYTEGPFPHIEDDFTDGPDAVTIDGWWYAKDVEGAIKAAVKESDDEA